MAGVKQNNSRCMPLLSQFGDVSVWRASEETHHTKTTEIVSSCNGCQKKNDSGMNYFRVCKRRAGIRPA
jgi:hypothetical protein